MTTPIVALDVPTLRDALALVERLGDTADFYKVGLELFTAEGPAAVQAMRARGAQVFLDLKLHDIPNTVAGAARSAARLGAALLTVHAVGGREMLRAAVAGASEGPTPCRVLAVTVLTSMGAGEVARAWGRGSVEVVDQVLRFAEDALEAGAHGIVCSGAELGAVRARFGDTVACLVPGVRFAGGVAHDQVRVVTPAEAVRGGARYIILGRAVTGSTEPAAAMSRVRRELGEAS